MGEIKVTDKRMFTPEGDLREEYRTLAEETAAEPAPAAPAAPPHREEPAPPARPMAPPAADVAAPGTDAPRLELPDLGPGLAAPSFFDLVALLAEPVALYLGDVPLPEGGSAENLEMARLHIDLLVLLRQKTAGNLGAQELAFLEDVLYRLRMRYVQKRG